MKKQHVQLTQTDRDDLETLISKGKLKARTYRRALGDRVSQTVDSVMTNYTVDMASGLTQVMAVQSNPVNPP